MDILGIDVGTVSIKYLRWRGKKGKGAILSTRSYAYRGGWEDLQRILSDIRIMEAGDLAVALAITSQEILKKTFTIPVLPKNELKEALVWSTSKVVSTPLEEMLYENVMLGPVDERGIKKDEVLFVGAAKGFVNRLLAVCEDAGFRKIKLITDTGVLYPALVEETPDDPRAGARTPGQDRKGSVAVIDIGGRQTGIYIIDAKKLRFVREIMTASESFSDALISGFGLSYEEAERYKQEKGFNEESTGMLSLPFERLSAEVQRTFNVYGQRYPERPIVRVYVTGRGAGMPSLVERLAEYVGEEIEHFSTPAPMDGQFLLCYSMCTTAESAVNLLPRDVKEKEKEERQKKWVRLSSVALLAMLLVLSLNTWSSLTKANLALQMEKAAVLQKKQYTVATQDVASFTRYTELVPKLKDLQKNDDTFLTLMQFLSSRLPKDVYLTEIEFDKYRRLKMASQELQKAAPPAPKEETSLKDAIKAVLKEALQQVPSKEGAGKKETPQTKQGVKDAGQQAMEDRTGLVTLSGYIVGDVDAQGLILLDLVIQLEKSGFMRDVDVVSKEVKEIKGKKVMEFLIEARCPDYEA